MAKLSELLKNKILAVDVLLGKKIFIIENIPYTGGYVSKKFVEENLDKLIPQLLDKFSPDAEVEVFESLGHLAERLGVHPAYASALVDNGLSINTCTPLKVECRDYYDAGGAYYTSASGVMDPKKGYIGPEPEYESMYPFLRTTYVVL